MRCLEKQKLCTSEIAAHLELGAPEHFRYLRESGCVSVPGIHDQKDFVEVEEVNLGHEVGEGRWKMCTGTESTRDGGGRGRGGGRGI